MKNIQPTSPVPIKLFIGLFVRYPWLGLLSKFLAKVYPNLAILLFQYQNGATPKDIRFESPMRKAFKRLGKEPSSSLKTNHWTDLAIFIIRTSFSS